jgi:type VI secretion system ImpA family protein
MALSIDLDPTSFSTPLEGDSPSGENLQATEEGRAVRSALRDLREEARRMERKADDGDTSDGGWPAARGIWAEARDQALDILRTRSRDLDVAAICIEALARTDGFAGLAAGFAMTGVMVESSWDTLFPVPDPEDGPADDEAIVNERSLPLQRLVGIDADGLLAPAILRIPFTQGRGDEQYAICHWRSSRELVNEESEEKIKLAIERGGVSPAQFAEAVSSTPISHLKEVFRDLSSAAAAWEALSEEVASASGGNAVVPAGPLRDLFEECGNAIQTFAPAAIPSEESDGHGDSGDAGDAADAGQAGGGSATPSGREDAFRKLEAIAVFFERNDPHSLTAAQIRNVVRLGRLPRSEYYRELLRDDAALALLFRASGMDGGEDLGGHSDSSNEG